MAADPALRVVAPSRRVLRTPAGLIRSEHASREILLRKPLVRKALPAIAAKIQRRIGRKRAMNPALDAERRGGQAADGQQKCSHRIRKCVTDLFDGLREIPELSVFLRAGDRLFAPTGPTRWPDHFLYTYKFLDYTPLDGRRTADVVAAPPRQHY